MDVLRSGKEAAPASVSAARNRNTLVKIPVGFMINIFFKVMKFKWNSNQSELGKIKVSKNSGEKKRKRLNKESGKLTMACNTWSEMKKSPLLLYLWQDWRRGPLRYAAAEFHVEKTQDLFHSTFGHQHWMVHTIIVSPIKWQVRSRYLHSKKVFFFFHWLL